MELVWASRSLCNHLVEDLQQPSQGDLADARDLAHLALGARRGAVLRGSVQDDSGDA